MNFSAPQIERGTKWFGSENRSTFLANAVLIFPIVILLLWHLSNRGLPNDDAANLAETAVRIAKQFDRGLAAGFAAEIDTRGWRPIVLPPSLAPFILLTSGDVVAACGAFLFLSYVAFTFYLYRLATLMSNSALAASVATAFVTSLPSIAAFWMMFSSESLWLLASTACVYHLLRGGCFQESLHSAIAGIYAGLMSATRPAESAIVLVVLLPFVVVAGVRRGSFRWHPRNGALLAVFAIPTALLVASAFVPAITRFAILLPCLAAIAASWVLTRRHSRSFGLFLSALALVTCGWWAGFMPKLYSWVETTSFGKMAQITDRRVAANILQGLLGLIKSYGTVQMLALLACFLLIAAIRSVRMIHHPRRNSEATSKSPAGSLLIQASGVGLILFAILYAVSGTGDPRRIVVVLVLFAVAVITMSIAQHRFLVLPVICLVMVQTSAIALTIGRGSHFLQGFGPIPRPHRGADGNLDAVRMLAASVPQGTAVAVYTLSLFQYDARIYEPAALQLAAVAEGFDLNIGYFWDIEQYDEVVRRFRDANYRYLLLDSHPIVSPSASHMPYVHFTADLLRRLKAGPDSFPGLRILSRFEVGGREQILFRVMTEPTISGWSDASTSPDGVAFSSSEQTGYSAFNLNDGGEAAWGSQEGKSDVFAGIRLSEPIFARRLRLMLFSPNDRCHLRQVRVVTADSEGTGGPRWKFVPARLEGKGAYRNVVTIPPLPDKSIITLEIDAANGPKSPMSIWGIACLRSQGDAPNYLSTGDGVFIRELALN